MRNGKAHRKRSNISVPRLALTLFFVAFAFTCSAPESSKHSIRAIRGNIVYGEDSREEFFNIESLETRSRLANSMVALVPQSALRKKGAAEIKFYASPLNQIEKLCPGEPYADQPAAAFCTGVLVDWDLVLTAGHCTYLFALEEFAIVFGYYYSEAQTLAIDINNIYYPIEIVGEALDEPATGDRSDFAWIRLDRYVAPPREPAPVQIEKPYQYQPINFMGALFGTPIKTDPAGEVRELRTYAFLAKADTGHGASGGGAFDSELSLLGILIRGGPDYAEESQGCEATFVPDPDTAAQEQFTYASEALKDLCSVDKHASSLCRDGCANPCQASPRPPEKPAAAGCSILPTGQSRSERNWLIVIALLLFAGMWHKSARQLSA